MAELTAADIQLKELIEPLSVVVTPRHIIQGAAASRDWQPLHHDYRWATETAKLPDIILNTPTQAGWLSRYLTDWAGSRSRVAKLGFRMKKPICPGDTMIIGGEVESVEETGVDWTLFRLSLSISVNDRVRTESYALLALPNTIEGAGPWDDKSWAARKYPPLFEE